MLSVSNQNCVFPLLLNSVIILTNFVMEIDKNSLKESSSWKQNSINCPLYWVTDINMTYNWKNAK
jgi:hypothetical protein